MPELPEVEAIRRRVEPVLVGGRVIRVEVARRDVVRDPEGHRRGRFEPALLGLGGVIDSVDRRGKQLVVGFTPEGGLVIRLGMSGRLDLVEASGRRPRPAHRHVVWTVETETGRHRLEFIDPRRFGGVHLARDREDLRTRLLGSLGPEATHVTGPVLHARLTSTSRAVKVALLDQSVVAGVGNIYADESLHAAGIHPECPGRSLDPMASDRLAAALRRIMARAIDRGGSTIRDHRLPDGSAGDFASELAVYGRGGESCPACGTTLAETRLAMRGTTWCPTCQPADRL